MEQVWCEMQIRCSTCNAVVLASERVNIERARPLPPSMDDFKKALRRHVKLTGHNNFHEGLGFLLGTQEE